MSARWLDRLVGAEGVLLFFAWLFLDSELARLAGYYGNPPLWLLLPYVAFAVFMFFGPWFVLLWAMDVWEGRR